MKYFDTLARQYLINIFYHDNNFHNLPVTVKTWSVKSLSPKSFVANIRIWYLVPGVKPFMEISFTKLSNTSILFHDCASCWRYCITKDCWYPPSNLDCHLTLILFSVETNWRIFGVSGRPTDKHWKRHCVILVKNCMVYTVSTYRRI